MQIPRQISQSNQRVSKKVVVMEVLKINILFQIEDIKQQNLCLSFILFYFYTPYFLIRAHLISSQLQYVIQSPYSFFRSLCLFSSPLLVFLICCTRLTHFLQCLRSHHSLHILLTSFVEYLHACFISQPESSTDLYLFLVTFISLLL